MSLEKIGVGGVLTFDSNQAVAEMGKASKAFTMLQGQFGGVKSNLSSLMSSMSGVNLVAMGLGAAGVAGVGGIVHQAIEANSVFEDMQTELGTTFNVLAGGGKLKEGLALAKNEMKEIERLAVVAPGSSRDLLNIYKQIVSPLSKQGKSLKDVRDMTLGAAIAAKGLNIDFDNMGFGLAKMAAGTVSSHDQIFRMAKTMGLITMEAAAWNALTPVERTKRLQAILAKYGESAEQVGNTWSAVKSTLEDTMHITLRAFGEPIFNAVRDRVKGINDLFLANQKSVESIASVAGEYLVPAFEYMVAVASQLWTWFKRTVNVVLELKDQFDGFRDAIGSKWDERLQKAAIVAGAIGAALSVALPAISLMAMFLGPVVRLLSLAWSLVSAMAGVVSVLPSVLALLAPALAPFLLIAAGLGLAFMAFRHDGEGAVDTIVRLWNDVLKPAWDGFVIGFQVGIDGIMEPLLAAWEEIKDSFQFLMDYLADSWNIGAGDARSWGATVGEVLGTVIRFMAEEVVPRVGNVIGAIIRAIAGLVFAFKWVGTRIGEVFGMMYLSVKNNFAMMFNAITEPIRNVLDFIAETIRTIANTTIGRRALQAAGINPEDAIKTANTIRGQTSAGFLSKAEIADIPGFSDIENPEQEVERKRAARALNEKANAPLKLEGVTIEVDDKREVNVNMNLAVDGKTLSQAQARQQLELTERAGATTQPWQKRNAVMRATPLKGR